MIHYGTIASGSAVVKDAIMRDEIRQKHGAIALETEAAGLMNNFPCIVIRGVSAYADSHKNDRWQPFAAAVAAAYAKELLEFMQPSAVDGEPAAKDILYQVHENVVKISKAVNTEQTQKILDKITTLDFEPLQTDILSQRVDETGLWLLQSEEFTQWLNQPKKTLFCPGILGAGKKVLCSIVVDYLRTKFQNDLEVQVGYIFCSYQPSDRQSTRDLLLSLLRQLAVKNSVILPNVEKFYKDHEKSSPNSSEIQAALAETCSTYASVFIVVDALDEYYSSSSRLEVQTLLSAIFNLQKSRSINLFATSRFNSEIIALFDGCITKEIQAQEVDIVRYVNKRLPELIPLKTSQHQDIQEKVRREVVNNADGMFLLARLHLDHLNGFPSAGELEEALSDLPHGKVGLELAYDKAIGRIESQSKPCFHLAVKALSWLTYTKRALHAEELQHALGTRVWMKELNRNFLPDFEIIDSLCAGLAIFDQNSGIIRLVHHTTKEYLLGSPTLRHAETEITKTCIAYLSFDAFSTGRCRKPEEYTRRKRLYPLLHYAAQNWGSHAVSALTISEEIVEILLAFLENEDHLNAAGQAMMASSFLEFNRTPHRLKKTHLAAYHSLTSIITMYSTQGEDLNAKDSMGRTPVTYAVLNRDMDMVQVLLDTQKVNLDTKDDEGKTPLLLATFDGNKEIATLLIKHGADINVQDKSGYTPLCYAAEFGDIEMMQLLLGCGARINHRCKAYIFDGGTPLIFAMSSGNKDAVPFLLNNGADPDFSNAHGRTLEVASRRNDEEMVNLLLQRGVSLDLGDNITSTLVHAVDYGCTGLVKQLLSAGADPNNQGDNLRRCCK